MPDPPATLAATPGSSSRWARWVAFLSQREAGTSLALFRIACGLGVVGTVGSIVLHGLVPIIWLNRADGGYRNFEDVPWLFKLLGGLRPETIWPVVAVALVAGLLLALGLGGRVPALLALQTYIALADINPQTGGSDDLLLANALWLLVLARSTATLSVDCRLRTGRWTSAAPVPAWPRYLAIYQLVLAYWATGMQKLGIHWTPLGDYSALYYVLQVPSWQRWDMTWLAWIYPLTQVATAVTWLWENSAPLLLVALYYRRTREGPGWLRALFNRLHFRTVWVLIGVGMHISLFVLMNVEPFNWVTLSYYVCLFRPEEWQAAWQRLRGWLGSRSVETGTARTAALGDRAWIAQARAAFVALHLLAITLMAFPSPGNRGMDRDDWKTPNAQAELGGWSQRLGRVGIAITPEELEERAWSAARAYRDVHQKLLAPFQPYYDYCGTYQSWRMFRTIARYSTRLHIEVEEEGRWSAVYVERRREHDWLGRWLNHSRFRPVLFRFGLHEDEDELPEFAAWVAQQAARDFPRADRVRVRYHEWATLSPEAVRAGEKPSGHFRAAVVLSLAKFR
jgi:hypothetical protein